MPDRITMFHPDAGTMQCSPPAAKVHERKGWKVANGAQAVTVPAADGTQLTTGTVFPPETFDTEPDSVDNPPGRPGADTGTPTTTTQET